MISLASLFSVEEDVLSKFQKDLAAGQEGEKVVREVFEKLNLGTVQVDNAGIEHDFRIVLHSGDVKHVEVKTDFLAAKTGNIFFEFECGKKPSGLSATKADWWAIYLKHSEEILVFCPQAINTWLNNSKAKIVGGGDGNRVRGFVEKISVIKSLKFVKTISIINSVAK